MATRPIIGYCSQRLHQPLPIETRLNALLNNTDIDLMVLYQSSPLTIIACSDVSDTFVSQLRFAWQQLSHSALLLLYLCPDPAVGLVADINNVSDWLQQLLMLALRQQASDIHIEAHAKQCEVRLRIAGQLMTVCTLSHEQGKQVRTRCKVLASLDITEQFLPQDGRFSLTFEDFGQRDFRVNSCPMLNGDKLVIRSLGTIEQLPALTELGLHPAQLQCTQQALQKQAGLVLVTGPTGSGKTSTLYAMLKRLNHRILNICTVEDPVELRFDGINQVPVSPQLTFATVLRALLRQDPDVLLIGEVRDSETAKIAIQAAQTGHLVLATMHTNSAIDSVQRLKSLGVPNDEIRTALSLLVSQRLLRQLCHSCLGSGCSLCQQGYYGQLAVFEVIPWRSELLPIDGVLEPTNINHVMRQQQLPSLAEHAQQLAQQQRTSDAQAQRLSENTYVSATLAN